MNLPSRVMSDVFQGTVFVPRFDFRQFNPEKSATGEFQLTEADFAPNGVCVPPAFPKFQIPYSGQDQPILDVRKWNSASLRRWVLDFTTEMHHVQYPGWTNISHLPEPFPQNDIQNFQKMGFSQDVAESFRYIRRGVYLKRNGADERLIIADQNLSEGKASLRVLRNGVGVTMETSTDGVIQRDFSVLLSRDDFLHHFTFDHHESERELMRSMAIKLMRAAEKVFEDQHGIPADLKGEHDVAATDLFPWPVESAQLYSQMDVAQLQQKLDDETYVPELVDQARIDAKIRGRKQRMVNVNWYNNGSQHFIELVVRRPNSADYLVGMGRRDSDKSQPVRNKLHDYIKRLQAESGDPGFDPAYYSELGLKFYVAP